jgi:antitoxin component of RelBE/YafQ-DinJ toxin-antitoxin module
LGLLAFFLTTIIGGLGTLWLLQQLRTSTELEARHDAKAMAQSVAQTLALQIGRAVRMGIPLEDIPGIPAYLQRALEQAPGLAYIALKNPHDNTLHTTQPQKADDQIRIAIQVQGQMVGAVVVGTSPTALTRGLVWVQALCVLTVLVLGVVSGGLAARGPGARLEREHGALQAGLQGIPSPQPLPLDDTARTNDGLQQALQALEQGQQQVQEQQAAVNAYAQELLAVDFDHRMSAPIAQIVQAASHTAPLIQDKAP